MSDTPPFDTEAVFDEDYLYFYEPGFSDEVSDQAVEAIWRLLELRPGSRVLDLACGHGRISNRLADRGCRVTGLDVTPLFLERARRDAAELGADVEYVEGDMRSLPWEGEFDAVVSWFTSFGYFTDDENRQVLREAAKALRAGGRLLIENNNVLGLASGFRPEHFSDRGDDLLVDRMTFDPLTNRAETERIVVRSGKTRRMRFFVRMFTFPELAGWLRDAGFDEVDGYGRLGEPLTIESWRMLTVARRAG